MLLRAWQHGARAARAAIHARKDITPEQLARHAQASRERAVATERSARLFLVHIHDIYALGSSAQAFIQAWRRYPLSVLRDAERAFRAQLHRDDIQSRSAYFAAIVRRLYDNHKRMRAAQQREREDDERQRTEMAQRRAVEAQWAADPSTAIRAALELVAMQWRPAEHALLYGGEGLGLGRLRVALRKLFECHHVELAIDIAQGALHHVRLDHEDALGPTGLSELASVAWREIDAAKARAAHCTGHERSTIFPRTGSQRHPCSPDVLRS